MGAFHDLLGQVLLNETRTEMDIQLNERLVADALEAVNLAGLDDEDVTRAGLELLAIHCVESATSLNELDLVVRMPMRAWPATRLAVEQEDGDVDVPVVGSNEIVRASLEREV